MTTRVLLPGKAVTALLAETSGRTTPIWRNCGFMAQREHPGHQAVAARCARARTATDHRHAVQLGVGLGTSFWSRLTPRSPRSLQAQRRQQDLVGQPGATGVLVTRLIPA